MIKFHKTCSSDSFYRKLSDLRNIVEEFEEGKVKEEKAVEQVKLDEWQAVDEDIKEEMEGSQKRVESLRQSNPTSQAKTH